MEKNRGLYLAWLEGILLFWALWYSFVALSDLTNFLVYFHLIPAIVFDSKNYDLVLLSFHKYHIKNGFLTIFAYFIVNIWNFITVFFSYFAFFKKTNKLYFGLIAFAFSIGQDAAFIILDEFFIQYPLEHGHMARMGYKVITLILFLIIYHYAEKARDSALSSG